jgi:hypothetical protein
MVAQRVYRVGYRLDDRGSIRGGGRDFLVHHRTQTGSGAHPASYPMDTGGCNSGG